MQVEFKTDLIPGSVQVPDQALIQLVGVPQLQIDKHDNPILNLTCRVVNFVISPRVYLKAMNQNGSSTLLTIGDTLVDDESGQRNGISEFRFQVELDAGMSTVECLGLDLYGSDATGGKWRKSGGARINITCNAPYRSSLLNESLILISFYYRFICSNA